MSKTPSPKRRPSLSSVESRRRAILDAALAVAAEEPWEFVSLLSVAEATDLTLDDVLMLFPDKFSIVDALTDELDTALESSFLTTDDAGLSVRDRLFDVLMERFDRMNDRKRGYLSMMKAAGWDRANTCREKALFRQSMTRTARCAGVETFGLAGTLRVFALGLGYLFVVRTWEFDTSRDLSATMASLDKMLARLESAQNYLFPAQ